MDLVPAEIKESEFDSQAIMISYLGFLASYSETSKVMVKSSLSKFYVFLKKSGISINCVDQNVVNLYLEYLGRQNISNGTFNLNVSYLKSFLSHIGLNFKYKTKKIESYENVRLINEDCFKKVILYIKNMMDSCDFDKKWRYMRDYIIFSTFYMTGLRKSEVRRLRHRHVFLEGSVPVYKTIIKGGREVKKEYPDYLYNLVRELQFMEGKTENDYIFTSKNTRTIGGCLANSTINCILNSYYKKATGKCENVTVHSIRNISALAVYEETKDLYVARDHVNHSVIGTTHNYIDKVRVRSQTPYSSLKSRMGA